MSARARVRAHVEGVVQGVGFRPFVHRLAREHTLAGWVRNDERGVLLEVEGEADAVERFLERLRGDAPPLAAVERVDTQQLRPSGEDRFSILPSTEGHEPAALVPADVAPCAACLRELLDPGDRRHRYPFINCTDCGPRFTIVRGVPYDRALTTMADYEMCADCRAEYEDPASRRFHAQPNACAVCGPTLRLIDCSVGAPTDDSALAAEHRLAVENPQARDDLPTGEAALAGAVAALVAGRIVAVKGLGGYHLACRADDERAVEALRRRKHRDEKPFALMAGDLAALEELVDLSPAERELCSGRERPIVIARRRAGARVAAAVAPGLADLGVMLPSTPLHHLLLADTGTRLVMTSGNLADEPIAHRDDDALERLGAVADAMLSHDRPIQIRADDSVVRSLRGAGNAVAAAGVASAAVGSAASRSPAPLMIRRARGYVPGHLPLPLAAMPLLACGAELKSTFCLATGPRAWVGQHIGDLRDWQALRSFEEGIAHFEALFAVRPEVVAHDLHPDYLSTAYAQARDDVELVAVQHHHAHLAAVLAEHGEHGPAIGAIYDGAGLGTDGTIWGGELLLGDLRSARRVGHLHAVRLPGGDAAVREPWRMACAWLLAAGVNGEDGAAPPRQRVTGRIDWDLVDPERWEQMSELVRTGTASPITTSVGRLCDAVAALCGIRMAVREEGRAAMELEAVAAPAVDAAARGAQDAYPLPVVDADVLELDARETVRAIVDDLSAGTSAALVSARFHNSLADATVRAVALVAQREDVNTAVLSGGVFQNRLLLERCITGLAQAGLRVLIPRKLPPNDGAISYGQAAVAAARLHA
ncbi:MAG TPA: carbamoyltransferase HypF [Solirubrobacteraceae bacterium]|nr:carbamoyltransferase HypF [Solirubrobacteraceae bacterium]